MNKIRAFGGLPCWLSQTGNTWMQWYSHRKMSWNIKLNAHLSLWQIPIMQMISIADESSKSPMLYGFQKFLNCSKVKNCCQDTEKVISGRKQREFSLIDCWEMKATCQLLWSSLINTVDFPQLPVFTLSSTNNFLAPTLYFTHINSALIPQQANE